MTSLKSLSLIAAVLLFASPAMAEESATTSNLMTSAGVPVNQTDTLSQEERAERRDIRQDRREERREMRHQKRHQKHHERHGQPPAPKAQ